MNKQLMLIHILVNHNVCYGQNIKNNIMNQMNQTTVNSPVNMGEMNNGGTIEFLGD